MGNHALDHNRDHEPESAGMPQALMLVDDRGVSPEPMGGTPPPRPPPARWVQPVFGLIGCGSIAALAYQPMSAMVLITMLAVGIMTLALAYMRHVERMARLRADEQESVRRHHRAVVAQRADERRREAEEWERMRRDHHALIALQADVARQQAEVRERERRDNRDLIALKAEVTRQQTADVRRDQAEERKALRAQQMQSEGLEHRLAVVRIVATGGGGELVDSDSRITVRSTDSGAMRVAAGGGVVSGGSVGTIPRLIRETQRGPQG